MPQRPIRMRRRSSIRSGRVRQTGDKLRHLIPKMTPTSPPLPALLYCITRGYVEQRVSKA